MDTTTQVQKLKEDGNAAFRTKNYAKAKEFYSKALDLDPTNAVLYSNRAICFQYLNDVPNALQDAEKAVAYNPTWDKAYYRKGYTLLLLRKYEDAVPCFIKALELDPTNNIAQISLAEAQYGSEHKQELANINISSFSKIIQSANHNIDVFKSKSFADSICSMSMNIGNNCRYLQVLVIDKDAKIISIKAPSELKQVLNPKSEDSALISQLQNGAANLLYVFVLVGRKGTEHEGKQQFSYSVWNNQSDISKLKSKPLTELQDTIMKITCKIVNKEENVNKNISLPS